MQRSAGVIISAIVAIAGSAILLLLTALMFVGVALQRAQGNAPRFVLVSVIFTATFCALFAGWGIATGVGLIKGKNWARISILVFSGLLIFFGVISGLVMALMPFVQPPNTPASPAAIQNGVRVALCTFYGLFAALGAGWLFFFNRAKIKMQFASGVAGASAVPRTRPLSISIIGVLFVVSGVMAVVMVALPFPATVLGVVFHGITARLLFVVFGAAGLFCGIGLLRSNAIARKVAIGYLAFGALNAILFVAMPGYPERLGAALSFLPAESRPPAPSAWLAVFGLISGLVLNGAGVWFLVRAGKRGAVAVSEPEVA